MSEENEPKEIEPKGSRILFCYFVVVLLLGLVAVGILFRAFDTAFVEMDEGGREPETTEPFGVARTWQYLFVGR